MPDGIARLTQFAVRRDDLGSFDHVSNLLRRAVADPRSSGPIPW